MKRIIIIALLLSLIPITAQADDLCFDGMCSIEVNCTTGKTTITRLSDAEIAIRLAQRAEQNKLAAIAEANKPKPIVIDTPTVVVIPIVIRETVTVTPAIVIETRTAQVIAPIVVTTTASATITTPNNIIVVDTPTATIVIPTVADTVTAIINITPKVITKKAIKKKGKK